MFFIRRALIPVLAGGIIGSALLGGAGCDRVRQRNDPDRSTTTGKTAISPGGSGAQREKGLKILSTGFTQDPAGIISAGILIENPERDRTATSVRVTIELIDDKGAPVESSTEEVPIIPQSSKMGVGSILPVKKGVRIAEVRASIAKASFTRTGIDKIKARDLKISEEAEIGTVVTGTAVSPYPTEQIDVKVFALIFDSTGRIKGGTSSAIPLLPAKGDENFEVVFATTIPDAKKAIVYFSPEDINRVLPTDSRY